MRAVTDGSIHQPNAPMPRSGFVLPPFVPNAALAHANGATSSKRNSHEV